MSEDKKTKILLIDNYDSFSYNLYQYIGEICVAKWGDCAPNMADVRLRTGNDYEIRVIRNDELPIKEIERYAPTHIIISPGPGRPADAGVCEEAIRYFAGKVPILGVCLGHQAICEAFGGEITYADRLMHGKQSVVELDLTCPIFDGLVGKVEVARYHSLVAKNDVLPDCLKVTAHTDDGTVMAVAHKECKVYGLQFHPESILTPSGKKMLENFLNIR